MLLRLVPSSVNVIAIDHHYLIDAAQSSQCNFLLRGIRLPNDWEYEVHMRNFNASRTPSITSVFLIPPQDLAGVSSSFVRGLIGPSGWPEAIKPYIPEAIVDIVMEKYHHGNV